MDVYTLRTLIDRQAASGDPYLEFLRVPDLSLGLYVLEAGAVDRQQPHTEDEAYVVLEGRARFTAGPETRDVGTGDTIFVAAGVPHRFHDIAETLRAGRGLRARRGVARGRLNAPFPGRVAHQPVARTRSTRSANAAAWRALVPSSSWRNRT